MSLRLTINDMQNLAREKGGKCLSGEYINSVTHLEWMCKTGHTWDSPYYVIQQGGWCPRCARFELEQEKYDEIKDIAKKHGIKCMSNSYEGFDVKLKFECKRGHYFEKIHKEFINRPICYECYRHEEREYELNRLLKLAREKNGKLLSKKYLGSNIRHKWECGEGHTWLTTPCNINRGTWCPTCAKIASDENQRKNRLPELQKHAAKKGGKVLSTEYYNRFTPIKWQCKEGHIWISKMTSVIHHGSWCRKCAYIEKRLDVSEFQKLAKKRKGKLLSTEYINTKTKLEWQCEKGHKWKARPGQVKKGTWCPACAGKKKGELKRLTLLEVGELAEAKGGKLLSKKYNNQHEKLKWRCKNGHIWETTVNGIRAGYWCGKCHFDDKRLGIEVFQKIAKEKGGELLSKKYSGIRNILKWKCAKGHTWETGAAYVKRGTWCPECGKETFAKNRRKYSIKILQEFARKKEGKLLSSEYKNSQLPIEWQCKEGHTWSASVSSVVGKGSWCNICNINAKKTPIEALIKLAKKRRGVLLSKKYDNNNALLKWQCQDGHVWTAVPKSVKMGSWCPTCRILRRKRLSIEEFHAIAKKRGGKLLSKEFVNTITHLKWECAQGHEWKAVPSEIKRGSWCGVCARKR